MKISTKARYGLRFMIALGAKSSNHTIQLNEIAQSENISEKYLSQIVISLKNAGLINSSRGARGGYNIPKKLEDITVYDIVTAIEGNLLGVSCLETNECSKDSQCVASKVWKQLYDSMIGTLKNINLNDLVIQKKETEEAFSYVI